MNVWKRLMVCTPMVGGLLVGGAALGPAVAAPPTPIDPDPTVFLYECADGPDLEVVVSGKEKVIDNPAGLKSISPGLRATVTNTESGESITSAITGTLRPEFLDNNLVRVKATGRNLLIRPEGTGLVLTSGNKTFVIEVDNEGEFVREVQGPIGPGRAVDLCRALA